MVTIRYRSERKKWVADYYENGVRVRHHFSNQKSAYEFARIKSDQLERKRAGMLFIDIMTFSEYSEIFKQNHFKFLSDNYSRTSKKLIEEMFIPCFGKKFMHDISGKDIELYRDKRIQDGAANKTVRNDLSLLNIMFEKAVDNQFSLDNPVKNIKRPKNIKRRERGTVEPDLILEFCRHADDELKKGILILANTGMRKDELFNRKGKDFDLKRMWLTISSTEGKTTKNYKSRRVPIPAVVANLVQNVAADSSVMNIIQSTFTDRFLALRTKLEMTWQIHELRHTYISQQLAAGVDKRSLREWVGHQSDEIIDNYSHYIAQKDQKTNVNIGAELLAPQASIVPIWSPGKKTHEKQMKKQQLNVPGDGIEPYQMNDINKLRISNKNS